MADEDPKPLTYIPEVILKKRKVNELAALRRKEQLELRKLNSKKNKDGFIKLPEEFVREYRARVTHLLRSYFIYFEVNVKYA